MKVFIAGPRAVSNLNNEFKERLNNIINNDFTILVGDCSGVDKQVQHYCYSLNYNNVRVYASNGNARNNIGHWEVEKVEVEKTKKGFEFYAAKDLEMAKAADHGLMIWNGKSKGTFNNIINLINFKKKSVVYFIPERTFYTIRSLQDLAELIKKCDAAIIENYNKISNSFEPLLPVVEQITIQTQIDEFTQSESPIDSVAGLKKEISRLQQENQMQVKRIEYLEHESLDYKRQLEQAQASKEAPEGFATSERI